MSPKDLDRELAVEILKLTIKAIINWKPIWPKDSLKDKIERLYASRINLGGKYNLELVRYKEVVNEAKFKLSIFNDDGFRFYSVESTNVLIDLFNLIEKQYFDAEKFLKLLQNCVKNDA